MPKPSTTTTPPSLADHNAVQKALAADPRAVLIYRDGNQMRQIDSGEIFAIADAPAAAAELLVQKQRVLVAYEPSVIIPGGCPLPPTWPPQPEWFDSALVATSDGKDSRVLLHQTVATYGPERTMAVNNLLGNEHARSADQAAEMCRAYGVRLYYTWKDTDGRSCWGTTVPEHIRALYAHDYGAPGEARQASDRDDLVVTLAEERGQWPGNGAMFCTSGGKRDTSNVLLRAAADLDAADVVVQLAEARGQWPGNGAMFCTDRTKTKPTDVLLRGGQLPLPPVPGKRRVFRTGERGAEGHRRSLKPAWQTRLTTPTRESIVLWERPLLQISDDDLWGYMIRHQIPVPALYWGLGRDSCSFCVWKSWEEVCLVGLMYPRPLARRVAAERRMGHVVNLSFRFGDAVGYQAVWAFLYGDFVDQATIPTPRPEAVETMLAWWRSGVYHRPPEGIIMLGAPEAPSGFDIAELPSQSARPSRARAPLPCDA